MAENEIKGVGRKLLKRKERWKDARKEKRESEAGGMKPRRGKEKERK